MGTTIQKWSGRETRVLREAMRMTIREFAAHLGVSETYGLEVGGRRGSDPAPP
jgi:DNA-binding transcriptional regulator YiaG